MAFFWTLLYSFTLVQLAAGQQPTDIAKAARQIIQRLETGSKEDRDRAELELVALGPNVLQHLPIVTDATSEALRSRLLRVRSELDERAVKRQSMASRVTLEGEMKLSAALAKIRDQTGNRIVDNRDNYGQPASDPMIRTDLKDVTFWEALDTVLVRAGMALDPMDTFRQEDAEFGIAYKYDLTGDLTGYKFVYRTPASILSMPVEFELKDIRLP